MEEPSRLFVYGTLALDDVVDALLDRIPHYQDATAPDWRIVRLPQRVYPGLVPGEGNARGKVFTDLTPAEWNILDAFEDPIYTLIPVRVLPFERDVLAYIWQDEHIDQSWSTAEFSRDQLAEYLDRCRSWRRRYEERSS